MADAEPSSDPSVDPSDLSVVVSFCVTASLCVVAASAFLIFLFADIYVVRSAYCLFFGCAPAEEVSAAAAAAAVVECPAAVVVA